MTVTHPIFTTAVRGCLLIVGCVPIMGCSEGVPQFPNNRVYAMALERETGSPAERAIEDTESITNQWFGTPDQPQWPESSSANESSGANDLPSLDTFLSKGRLDRAAGPVFSDRQGIQHGLYREHCAVCHGVSGSGTGPAASFMNPYPRDFRTGVFKFKSTVRGAKPTRADLASTLLHGIRGTAMPSFRLLPTDDLEALIEYTIYLSIRGEFERRLLSEAMRELGYGAKPQPLRDQLLAEELRVTEPLAYNSQISWIKSQASQLLEAWNHAAIEISAVPAPQVPLVTETDRTDLALAESIARGQMLFRGPVANCATCHGATGAGDGLAKDYDEWTKEWTLRTGLSPGDNIGLKPFRRVGALQPRNVQPRNLQLGVYRGGDHPDDIYRRITIGIEGTPMPAINLINEASPSGATSNQVWDLVNYVMSLDERN